MMLHYRILDKLVATKPGYGLLLVDDAVSR